MARKAAGAKGGRRGKGKGKGKKPGGALSGKLKKHFKLKRAGKIIAIIVAGGDTWPPDIIPTNANNNSNKPDVLIWVNADDRDYTIQWVNGVSPLQGGLDNIPLPKYDGVHLGTAGLFPLSKNIKPGTYKYTLTSPGWGGGPGDPGVSVDT
jgi:hypothetical protein